MFRQILRGGDPSAYFLIIFFSNTYAMPFGSDKARAGAGLLGAYFFCRFYCAEYNITRLLSSPSHHTVFTDDHRRVPRLSPQKSGKKNNNKYPRASDRTEDLFPRRYYARSCITDVVEKNSPCPLPRKNKHESSSPRSG